VTVHATAVSPAAAADNDDDDNDYNDDDDDDRQNDYKNGIPVKMAADEIVNFLLGNRMTILELV